jgi:hypothetical protein
VPTVALALGLVASLLAAGEKPAPLFWLTPIEGSRLQGRLVGVSSESCRLQRDDAEKVVPFAEVLRLERVRRMPEPTQTGFWLDLVSGDRVRAERFEGREGSLFVVLDGGGGCGCRCPRCAPCGSGDPPGRSPGRRSGRVSRSRSRITIGCSSAPGAPS